MKKFLAVLLAAFTVLSLVACGGGGKVPELKIEGEEITQAQYALLAEEWDKRAWGIGAPGRGWYSISYVQDVDMDYPENVNAKAETFSSIKGEVYYTDNRAEQKFHIVVEVDMDMESSIGNSGEIKEKVSSTVEITLLNEEIYTKITMKQNGEETVEYSRMIPYDLNEMLDVIDLVEFDSYTKTIEYLQNAKIYRTENGVMFEEEQKTNLSNGVIRALMNVDQNTGLATQMSAYMKMTAKTIYSVAGDKASYITVRTKQRIDLTAIDGAEIKLPDDIELYQ